MIKNAATQRLTPEHSRPVMTRRAIRLGSVPSARKVSNNTDRNGKRQAPALVVRHPAQHRHGSFKQAATLISPIRSLILSIGNGSGSCGTSGARSAAQTGGWSQTLSRNHGSAKSNSQSCRARALVSPNRIYDLLDPSHGSPKEMPDAVGRTRRPRSRWAVRSSTAEPT